MSFETVLVGSLQGITEWLPLSSEGVVAATYSFLYDRTLAEGVKYALWLHLGTVLSALIALRRDVATVLRECVTSPLNPSPFLVFLVVSTVVSAAIGFPLLLFLEDISSLLGASAMALVGVLMLVTGGLQLKRKEFGTRTKGDVSTVDAVATGLAQGLAVLPGLSRSGLTVSMLLARRVERRDALVLSFLMSIPASLGAALYTGIREGHLRSEDGLVAAGIAALVGIVAIRGLLALAGRINFGWFAISIGIAILLGVVIQLLA